MKQLVLLLCLLIPLMGKSKIAPLVVTAIPALEAIGDELVAGTGIRIENPLGNDVPLMELTEQVKGKKSTLDSLAPQISAVLSLRSIMPEDYLYLQLRQENIRIIEIDGASPLNPTLTAVGTIRHDDHVNPFIWLAPSAVVRSAEIIGKDLEALFPEHQKQIESNLQKLRSEIRALQSEYEQKFLSLDRFEAATMDNSFDYLLKDINLFVTLQLPGEMSWGEEELTSYKQGIANKAFATVIHRWVPFGDPAAFAEEAKIPFTVLNTGFPGMNHFDNGIVSFLRTNLDAIHKGLQ